jgi:RNA-directed DNA polymerase
MRGNSQHGNREIPEFSSQEDRREERSGKAYRQSPDGHAPGKSDGLVVPKKRTNKPGIAAIPDVPEAESVEGRGLTKGNAPETTASRTQSRIGASSGLGGVREAARRDRKMRFTALLHHVTPFLLRWSYAQLRRNAAPGIDGMTWREYGSDLEERTNTLHDRIHRGTYRAQPSKRAWIPKADGRQRPLGIAALEDKIVQYAVKTVLEQIYEEDFLGFSYGSRLGRGAHDALDALWVGLTGRKVNWVLDADIRGFFDAIDHRWLAKFIEHRIGDRRVLRLIQKWLKAGVSEQGQWSASDVGTPQGAVISPLLANVFLHYVFDLWVQQWREKHARGDVIVVRYVDDFVMGFQHQDDATRFLRDLRERFARFQLELHPEKTRLIEFGRYAAERRSGRGAGKPETFNFLGFTHISGKTRRGAFTVQRRSIAKRMRVKLREIKAQLARFRHELLSKVGSWLRAVVQGWYRYHAVPGNYPKLDQFSTAVDRLWLRAIRRRSQRGRRRWTWQRFHTLARRWLPTPRILHPYPDKRFAVAHPR